MDEQTKEKAVEIALAARDIVANSWHQGDYGNEDGTKFCAVGAVHRAAGFAVYGNHLMWTDRADTYIAHEVMMLADGAARAKGYAALPTFNDHESTTQQDVVNLLDDVATELKGL